MFKMTQKKTHAEHEIIDIDPASEYEKVILYESTRKNHKKIQESVLD